jgi:thiol-disulfide isomerase/thioredoxin
LLLLILSAFPALASTGRAPNLSLKDLEGNRQKLSALRGQIVVVSFWATWCGPCQEELPRLSQLAQEWSGKDIRLIAVSIDEPKDAAKIGPMLQRLHVVPSANLAVWVGSNVDTMESFGLGDIVPGTAVIDSEGNIVTRIMGEARNEDIQTAINWLIGGRSGTPPPSLVKRY